MKVSSVPFKGTNEQEAKLLEVIAKYKGLLVWSIRLEVFILFVLRLMFERKNIQGFLRNWRQ